MATKKRSTAVATKRAKKAPATTTRKKTVRRSVAPKITSRSSKVSLDVQIAVAAYYRAESRGFAPGCELEDWLAAESIVRSAKS